MAKITFEDKEALRDSTLPRKNSVTDEDINEIKTSVNALYDEVDAIDVSGKENAANKQDSLDVDGTGVKFPTVDAVNTAVESLSNAISSVYSVKKDIGQIVSTNTTAANDANYVATATLTFTDPVSPVAGKGFIVQVLIGSSTIGGTAYVAGSVVYRFHNGTSFVTKVISTGAYTLPVADGTSGYVLQTNGSGVVTWAAMAGSSDVCGIPNTAGVFTYYSTISAAITAATSGQTVEVLTDIVETGNVQIDLKNGVNINFNGHTYTLNNAGTKNAISDNNVAVECVLLNGIINRIGGTTSESDSCALYVDNTSTRITNEGMKFISSFGNAGISEGIVIGGDFFAYNTGFYCRTGSARGITGHSTNQYGFRNSAVVNHCVGFGSSTAHGFATATGSISNNCSGYSTGNYGGHISGGNMNNCSFYSSANFGGAILSDATANNCTFYSTAAAGLYSQALCYLNNCVGYSTSSYGLWVFNANSELNGCVGHSTANNGIRLGQATSRAYGCTAISTAAAAFHLASKAYNCTAHSLWNNAGGHAITGDTTAYTEVFNCCLETTHASANCLHYGSAINVKYGMNVFKGSTTDVNANITQTQANAPDTYGNIKIG